MVKFSNKIAKMGRVINSTYKCTCNTSTTTYSFTCSYLLHSLSLYPLYSPISSQKLPIPLSHSFLLLGFSWNHTEMEMERNKHVSLFTSILVAALLSQNLLIPVISTSVEDQKNYYSPDPHVGRPPSGIFLLFISFHSTHLYCIFSRKVLTPACSFGIPCVYSFQQDST